LHQEDIYEIYFAKRGKADRTDALRGALEAARKRFNEKWNIASKATIHVVATTPSAQPGLQAVDYYNWALQRFYERREERYMEYLWSSFRLVMDIDDLHQQRYGAYYTKRKPLTLAALEGRQ
jgi:hypothetical protein